MTLPRVKIDQLGSEYGTVHTDWTSSTQISVLKLEQRPLAPQAQFILQDEKPRILLTGQIFLATLGAVDEGFDVVGSKGTRWYNMYLVPSTGNDDELTVRAAANAVGDGGPVGFPNHRYVGAAYNIGTDVAPDLVKYSQMGSTFLYKQRRFALPASGAAAADGVPVELDLGNFVPASAQQAKILPYFENNAAPGDMRIWTDGEESGGASTAHLIVPTTLNNQCNSLAGEMPLDFISSSPAIFYQRTSAYTESHIAVTGWIDGFL